MKKCALFIPIVVLLISSCSIAPSKPSSSDKIDESSTYSSVSRSSASDIVYHTVSFNSNGGSTVSSQKVQHGYKAKKPANPTRLGYEFVNWTYQGEEWSFIGYTVTENMTLYANWNLITYYVTYDLNGGFVESRPITYTVEDSITLLNPTRKGYVFTGWYDQDDILVTTLGQTKVGDLHLEARWTQSLNNLTVESEDNSKGAVTIVNGSGYSDEQITVKATPLNDWAFDGWYYGEKRMSFEPNYSFTMPTNDYSLTARFFTKEEERARKIAYGITPYIDTDNSTVTFGLYPQKHINDSNLISSLYKSDVDETTGWYLFEGNYYAKVVSTTRYTDMVFDDGEDINDNTTYWFKCEPITWNILSNNNRNYYLLSSVLLDAHRFNEEWGGQNESGLYANNYEHSEIRKWLNDDFYNTAFVLEKNGIQTTLVDNSAATTDSLENIYVCRNTQDKVFLPSYQDLYNPDYGFSSEYDSDSRRCITTDFTRARGAYYIKKDPYTFYGEYWTRSPCYEFSYLVSAGSYSSVVGTILDLNTYCARPAITLKISI